MERRHYFAPLVDSADGITGTEAVAAQRRIVLLLSNNLKREYLEMCDFVRARMSLVIVIYNSLLLHGTRDKEAYIQQRQDLADGAVVALIVRWQG